MDTKSIKAIVTVAARPESLPMLRQLRHMVRRLCETDGDGAGVWRDPLSHPAIRAMSLRELADLPFAAGYYKRYGR